MNDSIKILKTKAVEVLHKATTAKGILALPYDGNEVENYTRIWARDSVMAGLAGLAISDSVIIEGLKQSLNTLKNHQSEHGIIPSNVSTGQESNVSYGGSAGRVDATLWYIIGALKYLEHTNDDAFRKSHIWHIEKALKICTIWEFNHKHLIYTPISGNWADEYPIHGYTLYDNCLRLWGLELYTKVIGNKKEIVYKSEEVRNAIRSNYILTEDNRAPKYNDFLFSRELEKGSKPYMVAGFNPSRYYTMFDAGGNGLACMLGLLSRKESEVLCTYIASVFNALHLNLMPAFWPIIDEDHELYGDIKSNFAYSFKNKPYHFHNGGIWPIMNGWLGKGLKHYGHTSIIAKMTNALNDSIKNENYNFSEYIASDTLQPGGKSPLCYSATGALMLIKANS